MLSFLQNHFSTIVIELVFALILFNGIIAMSEKDSERDIPAHHTFSRGLWLFGIGIFLMYAFYRWSIPQ